MLGIFPQLTYLKAVVPACVILLFMIVCSCNVLTDSDVRSAVSTSASRPRTAGQVYGCLGCSAQCGRCARTIRRLMDETLGACPTACKCCVRSPG